MREPKERLRDILEAIERIERYSGRGKDAMEADELIQNWFVSNIQVIGEAARALPDIVKDLAPNIPWRAIIGMRHVLVHEYFGIDVDAVWDVIHRDLPTLRDNVQELLLQLNDSPPAND